MASRDIKDLSEEMQAICHAHLQDMERAGIKAFLTCTYRSNEEQQELYNKGRTTKGPKVTNAKPGQSAHNVTKNNKPASLAYDIAILVNGKLEWSLEHPHWQKAGELGENLGLVWLGRPGKFVEGAHFQHKSFKL